MGELLSLFRSSHHSRAASNFLILEVERADDVLSVSPDVMRLGNTLFVASLEAVRKYQQKMAQAREESVEVWLERFVLESLKSRRAVVCRHPVEGLLFFRHIEFLGLEGFYSSQTLFSEKLYVRIPFARWFAVCDQLFHLFVEGQVFARHTKNYNGQKKHFLKFLQRIGVLRFGDLKKAQFYEIQKRFGTFFGQMWKWTFPLPAQEEGGLFSRGLAGLLHDFPWVPFQEKIRPVVDCHLEFPLSTWEQIEKELVLSFEKMGREVALQPPFRALSFVWFLRTYDGETSSITVNFKVPICLAQEAEAGFAGLKAQFQRAFEEMSMEIQQRRQEVDAVYAHVFIGWRIEVTQILRFFSEDLSLFASQQQRQDFVKMRGFDNKVKEPLVQMRVLQNQTFGKDTAVVSFGGRLEKCPSVVGLAKISAAGPREGTLPPIHIHSVPIAIPSTLIKKKKFLERSSQNWWELQDPANCFRDYYICELESGVVVWAFKDYKQQWFQHGIYS